MDHNDNKTAMTGRTGTGGSPTVVVIVGIMQWGQSQWGVGSNNNNYDDNNGEQQLQRRSRSWVEGDNANRNVCDNKVDKDMLDILSHPCNGFRYLV